MPAVELVQMIEPPPAAPLVERLLQRLVVAHVGLAGDDAPVKRLDLLDRCLTSCS
jgi:hypothetical protein